MQTPSHLIISAVLGRPLQRFTLPFSWSAFLFGSVLPDIPFALLTLAGEIYYRFFAPLPVENLSIMEYLHFDRFFNSWWWIIPHNFLHSLIINGLLIAFGYFLWRQKRPWGAWLFWLAISTQLHTIIDIFTHTSDGPLLLFPVNWRYRFASPVSYWESGSWFIILEYGIDLILLVYLGWGWYSERRKHRIGQDH